MMAPNGRATKMLEEWSPSGGPGMQYVIVTRDATVYSHSTGLADIAAKTPMSLSHTLSAFSMTKTLTAIAVLQLAERRELGIDDRVSKYVVHPYDREITIRQVLDHTAGIPNPIPMKWVHLAKDHGGFDETPALARVLAEHPKRDGSPGEEYGYSNIGYWMLGRVIESVSKQGYSDYVRKNIFQPLRLAPDDIDFVVIDRTRHAKGYLAKYSLMNLAKGFVTDKGVWGAYEGRWLHIEDVYVNGPSFGGAIGTARAFGRILQDLLADRSILLGDDSKRLLASRQQTRSGKDLDMTLGWHVGRLGEAQYFYKEGSGAGFHCEMRVYTTKGLASVLMTNMTSFNTRKQLGKIDQLFF